MSHQDEIEKCLESLFARIENCQNDSLRTSTPTYSEEAGGTDDTASISEAVDPNDKAFNEQSHPTKKSLTTVQIGQDFSEDPCEISYSEMSASPTPVSANHSYPWSRRRTGISGFLYSIELELTRASKKGYLLPFELICLGFALLCCFKGAEYWPMCPANPYIPRYVFFNGAIGAFSASVQVMDSLWKFVFRRYSDMWKYFCAFGLGWVAVITTLIEMTEFYTMSYSFCENEKNYCNETFYWFVYYKNIAFGVLVSLAALIYIPSYDFTYYYIEYLF